MKKIKTFYSNLRIKYKMFLFISIVLIAFSVGGLTLLQYVFRVYNEEIYRQSAQSLSTTSITIENELRKMERLSYQVATDQSIQQYLLDLKKGNNDFNRFILGTNIRKQLLQLGALNKYVNSIQLYDWEDLEYKVGNRMITITDDWLEDIKEIALAKEGAAKWVKFDEYDTSLIITRGIRYYPNLSLEQLGVIVIRVNIGQIISDMTSNLNKESSLVIFDEHAQLVYAMDNDLLVDAIPIQINKEKGYNIVDINDEKYFVTYISSQHMDWTYVILSPYSSLFNTIITTRNAVVIIYSILFLLILFIGMRFISNLTKPIESLNKKMKVVQTGQLDVLGPAYQMQFSKDELGEMHYNFQAMMNQINTLIRENYQKQIAIKDAEFKTLQAQINPHFLYNTLDSINWAAKMNGQKKISEIAEALGYLMRTAINSKESMITIEDELEIVNNYLTIQSYRFEERLDVQIDIADEIMNSKIPKFVLQPLIENSIQYGLQQMPGVCKIKIYGRVDDGKIVLTVEDNGIGMDEEFLRKLSTETYESKGTGLGLKNIKERIKLLFGEEYGLEIESEKHKGTRVKVIIPYS